jgi:hypothetical protein
MRASEAKVSDRRGDLLAQQKPLGGRSRGDDQYANDNPALPTIALKNCRPPMKQAEHQEQAHHQPNHPVGSFLNLGWRGPC